MAPLSGAALIETRSANSEGVGTGTKIKLSIRSVGKSYGAVTALADASLELAEGELLTLLGPSGSGKAARLLDDGSSASFRRRRGRSRSSAKLSHLCLGLDKPDIAQSASCFRTTRYSPI